MLKDVHHVSMYGLDLGGVRQFLDRHFGILPIKTEGTDEAVASGVRPPAASLLKARVAIFPVGPSLLEFMQPRGRLGRHYDVVRRNGGKPTVSHICWKLEDISSRHAELLSRGADIRERDWAGMSAHGGYYVFNIVAEEAVRGVWFQFAENLTLSEVTAIEEGQMNTRSHAREVEATGHKWVSSDVPAGALKCVHHVCYEVWGLDYMVDYMRKVFGVEPFKREDVSSEGLRAASFQFGRTIAQFVERTRFDDPNADFALRFGNHPGFCGGGVSQVGWAVDNLDERVRELSGSGVRFVQAQPVVSPLGGYRLIDTAPELSGGLTFQLCEDV